MQNPQLTACELVHELDQGTFVMKDDSSLRIIVQAIKLLSQKTGENPYDLFLKPWKNFKAQVSTTFYLLADYTGA